MRTVISKGTLDYFNEDEVYEIPLYWEPILDAPYLIRDLTTEEVMERILNGLGIPHSLDYFLNEIKNHYICFYEFIYIEVYDNRIRFGYSPEILNIENEGKEIEDEDDGMSMMHITVVDRNGHLMEYHIGNNPSRTQYKTEEQLIQEIKTMGNGYRVEFPEYEDDIDFQEERALAFIKAIFEYDWNGFGDNNVGIGLKNYSEDGETPHYRFDVVRFGNERYFDEIIRETRIYEDSDLGDIYNIVLNELKFFGDYLWDDRERENF